MPLTVNFWATLFLSMGCGFVLHSAILHVAPGTEDGSGDGTVDRPFSQVSAALSRLQPGDKLVLTALPSAIHEEFVLRNLVGTAEDPIIIDGQGVVMDGARVIQPEEWVEVRPGLFRHDSLLKEIEAKTRLKRDFVLRRFFLIVNDAVVRMGRLSKGNRANFQAPDSLQAGEWTFAETSGALYLALDPGVALPDQKIAAPVLANGIATRGTCRHVVVQNFVLRHFLNDGVNIHGQTNHLVIRDLLIESCGDDGVSAHGKCDVLLERVTSRKNSTGICHVDESSSRNLEVTLDANGSANLYLLGSGEHFFERSRIAIRGGGVRLQGAPEGTLRVDFERCVFNWPDSPDNALPPQVEIGTKVEVRGLDL